MEVEADIEGCGIEGGEIVSGGQKLVVQIGTQPLVAGVGGAVDKISLRTLDTTIQLINQTIANHIETIHSRLMQNHASGANRTFPRLIVEITANGGGDAAVVGVGYVAI